jgi:hypothetical protein
MENSSSSASISDRPAWTSTWPSEETRRRAKGLLRKGEWKSIVTDRTILRPGPQHEVEIIQRIFRSFVIDGKYETEIAKDLNNEGLSNQYGRPWNRNTIWYILSGEKYAGHNVYNRVSHKLKQKYISNPREIWVRRDNAFTPIVATELFLAARRKMDERNAKKSSEQMLAHLVSVLKQRGHLSCKIINKSGGRCVESYNKRFGSLLKAYQLIGYEPRANFDYINEKRPLGRRFAEVIAEMLAKIERAGLSAKFNKATRAFTNGALRVSIYIPRYIRTSNGSLRWNARRRRNFHPGDLTLIVRLDENNKDVLDYFLLPTLHFPKRMRFSGDNHEYLDPYCCDTFNVVLQALQERLSAGNSDT